MKNTARPRKRDGDERRRQLCDAGIRVLAEQGSRGLTHAEVDRTAGVPDGTTSYYYRTRAALLRGVGGRVAEIDVANVRSVTADDTRSDSPFGRLAQLTVMQATGDGLLLNRARLELVLAASRDPALAESTAESVAGMLEMTHEAVSTISPTDDAALRLAQADAVSTFVGGVFVRFAAGDTTLADPDHLERLLSSLVFAVDAARS